MDGTTMNDETKKKIRERYEHELRHGERFWPDSIFKDLIVSLGIFVLLIILATFIGVPSEPKADPSDTTYVPRPEWYFLFLFKFLALYGQIPVLGKIEWIATIIIPGLVLLALTLLPFIERSPHRYYSKRVLPISVMAIVVLNMVLLTLMADVPTVAPNGSTLIGVLQAIAGMVLPGLGVVLLFALAGVFKNPPLKAAVLTTVLTAGLMIGLTGGVLIVIPKPAPATTEVAETLVEQIFAGQDLYAIHCVECHGDDGKVTKIEGVKGLEGKEISAINGSDVLYTLNDASLAEVITYGRPIAGMNPFGKAYNPEGLSKSEIDYIVTFMRYSWDDRFELPPEALKPLFPPLMAGEVPSYDVHIQPIVKRYCLSCHRAGKENNHYWMDSYDNILHSGDNKDHNVLAGDPSSYLLQVIQGHEIPDPKDPTKVAIRTMPPNRQLKPNIVDVFVRWVLNGMPRTAEEAAKLYVPPTPVPTPTP